MCRVTGGGCHSDRGMLTTHYKYITTEKKCCSMQVRWYKLARYYGGLADWKIRESVVAGSAIGKIQPSWIEKANGNEKIRWLANLLFFCCIHRILMKNADSQTKMLKIRHSICGIISQIKNFVECCILRKYFSFKIRLFILLYTDFLPLSIS